MTELLRNASLPHPCPFERISSPQAPGFLPLSAPAPLHLLPSCGFRACSLLSSSPTLLIWGLYPELYSGPGIYSRVWDFRCLPGIPLPPFPIQQKGRAQVQLPNMISLCLELRTLTPTNETLAKRSWTNCLALVVEETVNLPFRSDKVFLLHFYKCCCGLHWGWIATWDS